MIDVQNPLTLSLPQPDRVSPLTNITAAYCMTVYCDREKANRNTFSVNSKKTCLLVLLRSDLTRQP